MITRVLVSEGASVGKDAPIIEIETNGETLNALPEKDLNKSGAATVQNARNEVDDAQKELERASVEMQRMEYFNRVQLRAPSALGRGSRRFSKSAGTIGSSKRS